jgi:hypothetical protein
VMNVGGGIVMSARGVVMRVFVGIATTGQSILNFIDDRSHCRICV